MKSKVGKLLIAHPNLPKDNWFNKTVIYIYADDPQQGTLGLALNVKTTLQVRKLCYDRGILYPHDTHQCYRGGPMNPHSCIMIHTDEWTSQNTVTAGPRYNLSSDNQMFERLAILDQPAYWRICLGISGWAPGQLDAELQGQFPYTTANSWLTADANDNIMFEHDGEDQWKAAVELSSQQMIDQFF